MRLIAITIYENAHGQNVAQLIEEDMNENAKYYESVEDIKKDINPRFPCNVIWINVDNLKTGTL